jgi:predicted acylesterase/phospholipase RssA
MESEATNRTSEQPPSVQERRSPSIWLSLSGGGFRAAIFHFGCLKRLHEIGLLGHVYAISATSGGALIAGLLNRYAQYPEIDPESRRYVLDYKWEDFERAFLELAHRGVLGPVAIQVIAYAFTLLAWCGVSCGLYGLGKTAIELGFLSLVMAIACFSGLAIYLLRERVQEPSEEAQRWAKLSSSFAVAEWNKRSWRRFFDMLLRPAFLRRQLLNIRAFKGRLLSGMNHRPQTFMNSVNLNNGEQTVFTTGVVTTLDSKGSSELWECRADRPSSRSGEIDIAQAVAASSAYPPFFSPVQVATRERFFGSFVDGGVVDNFAMNVPRAFSVHIHSARGQRYDGGWGSIGSFKSRTSRIMAIDGSAAIDVKLRPIWLRLPTALRILDIVGNQQSEDAETAGWNFSRNLGIPFAMVTLRWGFPFGSKFHDDKINRYVSKVRTHFDSFSYEEIATVAYCGYLWAEELVKEHPTLMLYSGVAKQRLTCFEEMLPDYCGRWETNASRLRSHLKFSGQRLKAARWIGRRFLRIFARSSVERPSVQVP